MAWLVSVKKGAIARGRLLLWVPALAVIVIVFAVAASVPSPPAFDFVAGHESVEDSITEEQAAMDAVSNNNMPLTAYSFKAEYSDIEKAADRELKSRGFVKEKFGKTVRGRAFYVRGSMVALGLAPAAPGSKPPLAPSESVAIYGDTRFSADFIVGPKPAGRDPGWITIIIRRTRAPGIFERFQRWLGF